jgi:ribonuclease P protein component
MTMFTREREAGPARLGIAATRKMGAAVERNRAKRLVRELFRHHKPAAALDVVVVPRREMLEASYDRIETEFVTLLNRHPSTRSRPASQDANSLRVGPQ